MMLAPLPVALFTRARLASSVAYARYAPSSPDNPTQKSLPGRTTPIIQRAAVRKAVYRYQPVRTLAFRKQTTQYDRLTTAFRLGMSDARRYGDLDRGGM